MNSTLYTNLDSALISELDNYIDSNEPSTPAPPLSYSQINTVTENLEIIKQQKQPGYIYAGDYASGYNYMNYYKHSNGNIYIMKFYLQEFDCYYRLDEWSKNLHT